MIYIFKVKCWVLYIKFVFSCYQGEYVYLFSLSMYYGGIGDTHLCIYLLATNIKEKSVYKRTSCTCRL